MSAIGANYNCPLIPAIGGDNNGISASFELSQTVESLDLVNGQNVVSREP